MTDKRSTKMKPQIRKSVSQSRLAAELRSNLKKRKLRSRALERAVSRNNGVNGEG